MSVPAPAPAPQQPVQIFGESSPIPITRPPVAGSRPGNRACVVMRGVCSGGATGIMRGGVGVGKRD
jgi:hypothetical protein